jgi:transposase-like protein
MAKALTVQDLTKMFPDNDSCLAHLMHTRFGEQLVCPKCGKHGKFHRIRKKPAYECQWCGHYIYPMAGTPFENSRTPLPKWFYAIYLFTTSRHGVPARELQRQLGVTYKTAWRMGHEIRKYMAKVDGDDGLSGHVEIDETYVGGRREGGKRGRGAPGKTIVFGMLQCAGNVMTHVVPSVKRKTPYPLIQGKIAECTTISSDELLSYATLRELGYAHALAIMALRSGLTAPTTSTC